MNDDQMDELANVLAPHFEREDSLFITTTNMCSWGEEYNFTEVGEGDEEIFESIENLDKAGMREIEHQDPDKFVKFLNKTNVPIDGKNPMIVLLKVSNSIQAYRY